MNHLKLKCCKIRTTIWSPCSFLGHILKCFTLAGEGERGYRDARYLPHQEIDSALLGNVVPYDLEFIQGILVPLHGHEDIGSLEGSLGGGKYP